MASVDREEDESISQAIKDDSLQINEKLEPTKSAAIGPADVLCGRGKTSFNHVGNKRFRDAVSEALPAYMKADNRYDKSLVVHSIVNNIRQAEGRFLKHDNAKKVWSELNDQQAKEKVGHAVRDAVTAFENRKKHKRRRVKEEYKSDQPPSPPPNLHQAYASLSTSIPRQGPNPSAAAGPYPSVSAASLGVPHGVYQEPVALPSGAAVASSTVAHPLQQGGPQYHQEGDPHDQFLAAIDSVLGPLPPDASDPILRLFDERQRRGGNGSGQGPGTGPGPRI